MYGLLSCWLPSRLTVDVEKLNNKTIPVNFFLPKNIYKKDLKNHLI